MQRPIIRLNVKELMKSAVDKGLNTDQQIASAIGVSPTQLWRAKLSHDDPRYSPPGTAFIAGVLRSIDGPFERYFFIDNELQGCNREAIG